MRCGLQIGQQKIHKSCPGAVLGSFLRYPVQYSGITFQKEKRDEDAL